MDIEFEEPDPEGPTDCKRCGVLIDHDAEKCDNCGFIQDRELAQQAVTEQDPNIIRRVVREEIQTLLEEPSSGDIEEASGIASMVDGMWQDSIDAKIENAVEEALENRTDG